MLGLRLHGAAAGYGRPIGGTGGIGVAEETFETGLVSGRFRARRIRVDPYRLDGEVDSEATIETRRDRLRGLGLISAVDQSKRLPCMVASG